MYNGVDMNNPTGYRYIEHTADIGLEARGETLARAFGEAAKGMFALMTDLRRVRAREKRHIELREEGYETLLFSWLNSLLYHLDTEGMLFKRFDITLLDGRDLVADCYGEPFDRERHQIRTAVKAATYHMLEVDEPAARVKVIFDI